MTIASTTNRVDYTGNGNVHTYAYTFRIIANTDLRVTVRDTADAETTLVYLTDYTVTGAGASSGGNVVLVNASQAWLDTDGDLKSGYAITVRRVRPITQGTDIRNQGDFYASSHEDAFDNCVMIDQQQQDAIDRSIKLPETVSGSGVDTALPVPSSGKLIGWDALGTGLQNYTDLQATSVSAFSETYLDDTTALATRATLDAAQLVSSATTETSPAAGDYIPLNDVSESATAENKITLENVLKVVGSITADTAPAIDDSVLTYDLSATAAKKVAVSDIYKTINTMTADPSPQLADSILTYDASASAAKKVLLSNAFVAPTTSVVTASSHTGGMSANSTGTYTVPTTPRVPLYIRVKMVGGGGGSDGPGGSDGGTGGTTTFGSSLLTATGGQRSNVAGTATVNSPAVTLVAASGGKGGSPNVSGSSNGNGGHGGSSPFGGAGCSSAAGSAGSAAQANTGSGAGGSGGSGATIGGYGGSSGGYIEAIIFSPSATYAYTVGAGGTAGAAAGSPALAGAAGAPGIIIVEEHYQ